MDRAGPRFQAAMKKLTPAQLTEAQNLVQKWKPKWV
jgi:hypothetical protein